MREAQNCRDGSDSTIKGQRPEAACLGSVQVADCGSWTWVTEGGSSIRQQIAGRMGEVTGKTVRVWQASGVC